MSRQIQIRRGTAAEHETFTGAVGELTFDGQTLRVHDGTTVGGIILARADEITTSTSIPDNADYVIETWRSEDGKMWYRKYNSGWVEQGGCTGSTSSITGIAVINLPVEMCDTNYTVNVSVFSPNETSSTDRTTKITSIKAQSFSVVRTVNSNSSNIDFFWQVCGFFTE